MSADARRHVVIAIYGVGNPAPGDVERSLGATLRSVVDGIPKVQEFDWNEFAPQAPRTKNRSWRYAQLFSGSFASAAWVRSSSPTRIERVRTAVDALVHGLWAGTQAVLAALVVLGVVLYLVGATSDFFAGFVRSLTKVGFLPGGVGWRASALAGDVLTLAVREIRYGSAVTAALLAVSASLAVLEAVVLRSTRPIATTARRHMFVLLLAPCALLSLVTFWRDERELLLDVATVAAFLMAAVGMVVAAVIHGFFGLFFGGTRITVAWSLAGTSAILAMAFAGAVLIVIRFLRGTAGPVWLAGAKVLLDIGLYAGTRSYRDRVQEHLTRKIASIPDRSSTTIWVVAHSLGSVMALDSLTNSDAWTSTDGVEPFQSVRLVTLGSPIRRFFIRFFPGLFFEPQIDAAARTVAQRVGEFTWLNAFRRFDYIGTALSFRESGLDLPTRQVWPAHANYWGDERVARIVIAGCDEVRPVEPPAGLHTPAASPAVLTGVPEWLRTVFRHVGRTCGWALGVVTLVAASWLMFPGVRELVVRPTFHLQTPAYTTARVRHERGFAANDWVIPIRFHEFRFDFRDEVTGREHHLSASVPGFFRVWSDPRFDYLALARFIRGDCRAERVARFYEFGWSVPCSRDGLPIAYDRLDPSRFSVLGFEETPGLFVRALRAVWKAFIIVAVTIVIYLGVRFAVVVLWRPLWDLFVGEQEDVWR